MEHQTTHSGLSDEQIAEFQSLYFKQFNVQLSKDEALTQGLALVRLVKVCVADANEGVDHDSTSKKAPKLYEGFERDY